MLITWQIGGLLIPVWYARKHPVFATQRSLLVFWLKVRPHKGQLPDRKWLLLRLLTLLPDPQNTLATSPQN